MELNRRQWYVRWFFWSLGIWDEFRERDEAPWFENRGTNLCHFMRVIFFYAPLVIMLNLIVYTAAIAALTAVPIYFFGSVGYAWILGTITFVVVLFVGIKYGHRWLLDWLNEKNRQARRAQMEAAAPTASPAEAEPKGPGFWEMFWGYVVAMKRKICPIITFNQSQPEAAE